MLFFCIMVRYDQGNHRKKQKDFVRANSGTFVVSDDTHGILRKAITEQE